VHELEDIPETDIERRFRVTAVGNNAERHLISTIGAEGEHAADGEAARALGALRSQLARLKRENETLEERVRSIVRDEGAQHERIARLQRECDDLHQQLPELKRRLGRCRCGAAGDREQ
jgi:chromosome segregation ATPase